MAKIKTSLIVVVLNEENSIDLLLDSIMEQSKKPDECVFVDGGSKDNTLALIKNHSLNNVVKVRFFVKKGNISKGRNEGIKEARGDIIAFTDAGCILDKNWFENITKPLENKAIEVVAGYYRGAANNVFQKCLVPYVLVMPDRLDAKNFLPATRSMAIRKIVFEQVGKFREDLDQAEDFEFAKRIKSSGIEIKFQKNAVVAWIPRGDIISAFMMFYRYALGDIMAGIIRPKIVLIFVRYTLGFIILLITVRTIPGFATFLLILFISLYIYWSILKNFKYVRHILAIFYLPLIQITSDLAVMVGATFGLLKRLAR